MKKTGIEWTEATWNPIRGCSRVSEGCRNCYAEIIAARFSGEGQPYEGLADFVSHKDGYKDARWTGNILLVRDRLGDPMRWRKPRLIFVNSMSDMFHENLDIHTIKYLFGIMERANHHEFQVLTKRPERMLEFSKRNRIPPNVWMGVSVEDHATVKRLDYLSQVDAEVRFVSAEPLLEDISTYLKPHLAWLDWLIVGGESGIRARPMDRKWAVSIWLDCRLYEVPFFFKQMGGTGGKDKGSSTLYQRKNGVLEPLPSQHEYPERINRLRNSQQEFKNERQY